MYLQVAKLDASAQDLMQKHPDQADSIKLKFDEITETWTGVTDKANNRKAKLLDSYDYQKFLSEFRFVQLSSIYSHVVRHTYGSLCSV